MATILCIDDEQHLLDDIAELMESCGHKAIKANDGKKGLQMILHLRPDLVISDISMPGMSGIDLVREIRENYPDLAEMPFIFLSALSDRNDILTGLDEGGDDYLTKPVDFDLLDRKVISALRQVARIKQKNEWELIKLVDSLSDSGELGMHDETITRPKTSQADFNMEMGSENRKIQNKRVDRNDLDWRDKPKSKKVHGATLNIKDNKTKKTNANKNIVSWVANTATDIVKQLFPEKGAVVVNKNGGVFVCYNDANESAAANRTETVKSKVQKQLKDPNIKKPIPQEEVLDLSLVAEAPYETEIDCQDIYNIEQFSKVVENQVEKTVPKIQSVSDLLDLLQQRNPEVVMLKMLDRKGRLLPIKFFNFDARSREYISIAFSNIDENSFGEAGYKIDSLFLQLLAHKLPTLDPNSLVMVDVHYNTLIAAEYQRLYIPKVKDFAKTSKHKLILNIRGVTRAAQSKTFREVLKPLGIAAKGCTIQITPEQYEDFIKSPLPVSGIVCSYLQTNWNTFSAELVQKARASLANSRIPMIVRGVPSLDDAAQLQKFGFDGYGISED